MTTTPSGIASTDCVYELSREYAAQQMQIIRGMRAAEHLHGHFYEVYQTTETVDLALQDVIPLLEILWGLLPDEYTGGGTFIQRVSN